MPSGHGPPDDLRAALPASGALTVDIVSSVPPPEASRALPDGALAELLRDAAGFAFETRGAVSSGSSSGGGNGSGSGSGNGSGSGTKVSLGGWVPRPATDTDTADRRLRALRALTPRLAVTSAQARAVVAGCFAAHLSPHRVEAAVTLWAVTVDRADGFWIVRRGACVYVCFAGGGVGREEAALCCL